MSAQPSGRSPECKSEDWSDSTGDRKGPSPLKQSVQGLASARGKCTRVLDEEREVVPREAEKEGGHGEVPRRRENAVGRNVAIGVHIPERGEEGANGPDCVELVDCSD